ncbi:hypothetical protein BkAM31D_06695 [Halalkalibacter krulwichiae]|uniref:Uncharacterized protein n=1 Tax=Halalkalibacter krulwichiae TaxID=199441 RepID=A0A1X9MBP1_9BACI|nr:hypothetical protein BkAM31D_06695 [Halalkalibacter krulwichiae]
MKRFITANVVITILFLGFFYLSEKIKVKSNEGIVLEEFL